MKKALLGLLLLLPGFITSAQGDQQVENLIKEGIELHDKGDYEGAIKKYDAALKIDKHNFDANYEKGYSLYTMGKIKECASLSKDMIKEFAGNPALHLVYMQYGSSLDDLGKSKEAIDAYDEGIKIFPDEYLLHFNRALTLQKMEKTEDALLGYQSALSLKALHSSSNYYTGMLLHNSNKVAALMAYITFMAIEPQTKRSEDAFKRIEDIMNANIKKDGDKTVITLDASMFDKGKKKEDNNFSSVEMMLSLLTSSADTKGVDSIAKTPVDKLSYKLQMLISLLSTNLKDGKGFYWTHYAPFLIEMKEKDQVGTLAHLMYMQARDEDNNKWLESNEDKLEAFYDWLKAYQWK